MTKNGPLRTRVVTFRVTEEEYEQLLAFARLSGLSLSDYLRSAKARPQLAVTSASAPLSVTWRAS